MILLKRRSKVEKGTFHSNLKLEGMCPVPYSHPISCGLDSISSFKVNAPIMSVFFPLHYFYLQKSFYK